MRLAVNYSHAAVSLRQRSRLPADLLKCPDWPDHWPEFSGASPVYIHFRHMAGARRMNQVDWNQTAYLRDQSHSPFVNLHIAPYLHWLSDEPTAQEPSDAELFDLTCADISETIKRFGKENVIIENAPYQDLYGTMARTGVDPVFLSRLVGETGCGFLLDLAHARITARQLGIPEKEYVGALPLHRLCELHITGLSPQKGILVDHFPMTEDDWPSAKWALDCIHAGLWTQPWVVTFEYGGIGPGYEENSDPQIIEMQVTQFYKLMQADKRALEPQLE
jgi:uncharacterized protein